MGFYAPHVLVNDGKRHGVEVLPPDINLSGASCTIGEQGTGNLEPRLTDGVTGPAPFEAAGLAVRVGLRYVRGMSEKKGAKEIGDERNARGDFRSLFDFIERTRLRREVIENLIACGAFDSFGLERRELIWQLGLLYRSEGRNTEQRQLALPLPTDQDMVRLASDERLGQDARRLLHPRHVPKRPPYVLPPPAPARRHRFHCDGAFAR